LSFLPEFLAGVIGLVVGFLMSRATELRKEEMRVPAIKRIIRDELKRIKDLAPDVKAKYLPTDAWNALVSPGDSRLLAEELQQGLFRIYAKARVLNIQYEWEPKEIDEWERIGDERIGTVRERLAIPNRELGIELHNMINKLLRSNLL